MQLEVPTRPARFCQKNQITISVTDIMIIIIWTTLIKIMQADIPPIINLIKFTITITRPDHNLNSSLIYWAQLMSSQEGWENSGCRTLAFMALKPYKNPYFTCRKSRKRKKFFWLLVQNWFMSREHSKNVTDTLFWQIDRLLISLHFLHLGCCTESLPKNYTKVQCTEYAWKRIHIVWRWNCEAELFLTVPTQGFKTVTRTSG